MFLSLFRSTGSLIPGIWTKASCAVSLKTLDIVKKNILTNCQNEEKDDPTQCWPYHKQFKNKFAFELESQVSLFSRPFFMIVQIMTLGVTFCHAPMIISIT